MVVDTIQVMTDAALEKFLKIREKWDPEGRFPGYKALLGSTTLEKRKEGGLKSKI